MSQGGRLARVVKAGREVNVGGGGGRDDGRAGDRVRVRHMQWFDGVGAAVAEVAVRV